MTIKDSGKHKYLVCKKCKKSIRYDYLEIIVLNKLNNCSCLTRSIIDDLIIKIIIGDNVLITFKELL